MTRALLRVVLPKTDLMVAMILHKSRALFVATLVIIGLPLASCDSGGGSDPVQVPSAWSGSWELAGFGEPGVTGVQPPESPLWWTLSGNERTILDGEDCRSFTSTIVEISGNTMRLNGPEGETIRLRVDEVTGDSLFVTEITEGPGELKIRLGEEPQDPREVAPGCPSGS